MTKVQRKRMEELDNRFMSDRENMSKEETLELGELINLDIADINKENLNLVKSIIYENFEK